MDSLHDSKPIASVTSRELCAFFHDLGVGVVKASLISAYVYRVSADGEGNSEHGGHQQEHEERNG